MNKTDLIIADVFEGLSRLPDDHFDCCVTSPPYWGLRDYGVEGQIGMEKTLGEHLDVMVRVFEEIRRVLKPSGTLWLNYGDCYASTPNGQSAAVTKSKGDDRTFRDKPMSTVGPIYDPNYRSPRGKITTGDRQMRVEHGGRIVSGGILKPKDLCMIPNRLAIALQEAGWWVRSEIIWGKPSPMPESVRDRPATAHEKIFLLSKSSRYFYDCDAVRQMRSTDGPYKEPDGWDTTKGEGGHGSIHKRGRDKGKKASETGVGWRYREEEGRPKRVKAEKQRGHGRRHNGFNDRWDLMDKEEQQANGRHLKNYEPPPMQVWRMNTAAFSGAHFATFPPELVERCLKAGCPVGGNVLDPFGGSGTTAMVANQMGRDATIIELNPDYAKIAWERIKDESPLYSEVNVVSQQDFGF